MQSVDKSTKGGQASDSLHVSLVVEHAPPFSVGFCLTLLKHAPAWSGKMRLDFPHPRSWATYVHLGRYGTLMKTFTCNSVFSMFASSIGTCDGGSLSLQTQRVGCSVGFSPVNTDYDRESDATFFSCANARQHSLVYLVYVV